MQFHFIKRVLCKRVSITGISKKEKHPSLAYSPPFQSKSLTYRIAPFVSMNYLISMWDLLRMGGLSFTTKMLLNQLNEFKLVSKH